MNLRSKKPSEQRQATPTKTTPTKAFVGMAYDCVAFVGGGGGGLLSCLRIYMSNSDYAHVPITAVTAGARINCLQIPHT